jgi:hypothetical protein
MNFKIPDCCNITKNLENLIVFKFDTHTRRKFGKICFLVDYSSSALIN